MVPFVCRNNDIVRYVGILLFQSGATYGATLKPLGGLETLNPLLKYEPFTSVRMNDGNTGEDSETFAGSKDNAMTTVYNAVGSAAANETLGAYRI